jgi:hypothetical protein
MLALVVLVGALVAVVGIALVVQEVRLRRSPPELKGDWWTAFEREFRAYAREIERSRHIRSRRWDQPGEAH